MLEYRDYRMTSVTLVAIGKLILREKIPRKYFAQYESYCTRRGSNMAALGTAKCSSYLVAARPKQTIFWVL
jgi:hypothetical protein